MSECLIIKLGTQVAIDGAGLALDRLRVIVDEVAELRQGGKRVVLVSSGAVGMGRKALDLSGTISLKEKQACAAVGQNLLMDAYRELFGAHGILTAQLLLTADDFSQRERYLNLQATLETLLGLNAVPIVNENDCVSVAGIREGAEKSFDDNDKLSALVAAKLGGNMLIILTNVAGVYSDNPAANPDAKLIQEIDDLAALEGIKTSGVSALGRGGMESKVNAARIAGMCGVTTLISSGFIDRPLHSALAGGGTRVLPSRTISGKKRWIGISSGYSGVIVVNAGTRSALVEKKTSLLPIGVQEVRGEFAEKDIVSVHDTENREIGRGVAEVGSVTLRKIMGLHTRDARALDAGFERDEIIHRDNLVIFE